MEGNYAYLYALCTSLFSLYVNTRQGDTDAENLENMVAVWRQEGLEDEIFLNIGYVSIDSSKVFCYVSQFATL